MFLAAARQLRLPETERADIVSWLAANPESGDVIEGTGGARKVRFAGRGKGKSGGYRVILSSVGRTYQSSFSRFLQRTKKPI